MAPATPNKMSQILLATNCKKLAKAPTILDSPQIRPLSSSLHDVFCKKKLAAKITAAAPKANAVNLSNIPPQGEGGVFCGGGGRSTRTGGRGAGGGDTAVVTMDFGAVVTNCVVVVVTAGAVVVMLKAEMLRFHDNRWRLSLFFEFRKAPNDGKKIKRHHCLLLLCAFFARSKRNSMENNEEWGMQRTLLPDSNGVIPFRRRKQRMREQMQDGIALLSSSPLTSASSSSSENGKVYEDTIPPFQPSAGKTILTTMVLASVLVLTGYVFARFLKTSKHNQKCYKTLSDAALAVCAELHQLNDRFLLMTQHVTPSPSPSTPSHILKEFGATLHDELAPPQTPSVTTHPFAADGSNSSSIVPFGQGTLYDALFQVVTSFAAIDFSPLTDPTFTIIMSPNATCYVANASLCHYYKRQQRLHALQQQPKHSLDKDATTPAQPVEKTSGAPDLSVLRFYPTEHTVIPLEKLKHHMAQLHATFLSNPSADFTPVSFSFRSLADPALLQQQTHTGMALMRACVHVDQLTTAQQMAPPIGGVAPEQAHVPTMDGHGGLWCIVTFKFVEH